MVSRSRGEADKRLLSVFISLGPRAASLRPEQNRWIFVSVPTVGLTVQSLRPGAHGTRHALRLCARRVDAASTKRLHDASNVIARSLLQELYRK